PAACAFFPAAGEQLLPVVVDFLLVLAVDHERNRLGELELRPAVQRDELLVAEPELHRQDVGLGAGHAFEVAHGAEDLRLLEDRAVELGRLLGFLVVPEECGDLLHGYSPGESATGSECSAVFASSSKASPAAARANSAPAAKAA